MGYIEIDGFPANDVLENLESSELKALSKVWKEKKNELEETGEYKEFVKKMQREWAIETGIIERLYSWDRGVTEVLIEHGIDSSLISHKTGMNQEKAKHVQALIEDHYNIVNYLFDYVKGDMPLSEYFIRSMHEQFTDNQDTTEALTPDGKIISVTLKKGAYKDHPNNPKRPDGEMHYYCPPERVHDEMEKVVSMYLKHEKIAPPEVLSAWLHHRFTQIHPFQDGNGRVARALASLVFLKVGLFPLVIREKDRIGYIDALESADKGDLEPLVSLFAKRQRDSILSAIGIQQQVQQAKHAEQIINSTLQTIRNKLIAKNQKHETLLETAEKIHGMIVARMCSLKNILNEEFKTIDPEAYGKNNLTAAENDGANNSQSSHFYYRQIVDIARQFDYYVNLDTYKSWVKLTINTEKKFEIVFSIHGYGHISNGIMAVSSFTAERVRGEETTDVVNLVPACLDLFQFNYIESQENTLKRFEEWLEASAAIGLATWNKTIT